MNNHIEEIADFARHRSLVVFCGAGISVNSGLPQARRLVRQILQAMGADADVMGLLIEAMQPLESLLERVADFSGSIGLAEIIGMFRAPELSPTSNHKAIASMGKMNLVNGIVTTNFDALLEQALAALEVKYAVYRNEEEFSGAFVHNNTETPLAVVKLHGCADGSRTRELGATLSRVAADQQMPAKIDILTRIFSSGGHSAVLVLGYSCSDVFDIVPIVQSLQRKTKKIFFVEHLLPDDPDVNAKKKRFECMFNGFDAVWLHADTDQVVTRLLGELGIDIPDGKRLSFDWTRHIGSWQRQAESGVCSLILGTLLSDISQYRKALHQYQFALEQIDRELDRPVEDIFLENYHKLSSIDSMLHMLREDDVITQAQFQEPYERRVRCLGMIGQVYKNLEDYESASRYLTEAVEKGEQLGHAGAWVDSLGNVWERLGDYARARSYHERAVQEARSLGQEKSLVTRQCNLGNVYSALGETDQARTLYVEALGIAERIGHVKGKVLVLANLAVLETQLERYEYANGFNEQALELAVKLGDEAMTRQCLERSYYLALKIALKSIDSSNYKDALAKLQMAAHAKPDNAGLHALLGSVSGELGHYAEALEALNTAVRLDPRVPRYYIARGTVLDHLGRSAEALADYRTAIELAPASAQVYYERGVTYRDLKDWERALQDFLRAIELNDQYHEAYLCTAQILSWQGKLQEARRYALEAQKRGNPNARHFAAEIGKQIHAEAINRGLSQMHAGNLLEAVRTFDQIIEHDPEFSIAFNYRGLAHTKLRCYEQAMNDYASAIELYPTDATAYNNRGNLFNEIGRETEAMKDYDLSIQYSPETAEPYANKGAILANAGKWAEALPLFEQAASLGNKPAVESALMARARLAENRKSSEGWGERAIKAIKNAFSGTTEAGQEEFWGKVHALCSGHVHRNVQTLKEGNWSYMDWAENRLNRLTDPSILDQMIREARGHRNEVQRFGQVGISRVAVFDGWYVVLTVWPSAQDKDFLAACPEGSFERLAWNVREEFYKAPSWQDLDFAHWFLLVDSVQGTASLHLQTMWNFKKVTEWIGAENNPRSVRLAPVLLPLDLMCEDPSLFVWRLYGTDLRTAMETPEDARQSDAVREALAWFERGVDCQQKKQIDQAIDMYTQAIQLDPTDGAYYFNRGLAYHTSGQHVQALADFNEAIRLHPEAGAYYLRGLVHMDLQQLFEALADFNRALDLSPDDTHALAVRAAVHSQLSMSDKAVSDFTKVIELNPENAAAYAGRAYEYRLLRRNEEAERDMQKVAQLDPAMAHKLRGFI